MKTRLPADLMADETPLTPESDPQSAESWSDEASDSTSTAEPEIVVIPMSQAESAIPRAISPQPRLFKEPAPTPTEPEKGLRIDSRFPSSETYAQPPSEKPRPQIVEYGKKIIRLDSEPTSREESLPIMQPRQRSQTPTPGKSWGESKSQSLRWLWWSAGITTLLIISSLWLLPYLETDDEKRVISEYSNIHVVEDVVQVDEPLVYFNENPGEASTAIQKALSAYAQARTLDEAMPYIRHADKLRKLLEEKWKPWNVPTNWTPANSDMIIYDSVGNTPFAMVTGGLPDFSQYRAYLIRENNTMLVDWEASVGFGTHSIAELRKPGGPSHAEVRVTIAPTPYYTESFPEKRFHAYRLVGPNHDDFLWAYARVGSPAAEALDRLFLVDAVFSDRPAEQMVHLRLIRPTQQNASPTQWEILDVLHKGWVTP